MRYYYEEHGDYKEVMLALFGNRTERKQRRLFMASYFKSRFGRPISQLEYEKRTGRRGFIHGVER